ncbi:MAG: hypothetical protein HC819_05650 [Cyclobacteriaceae bacterium]|nr:hypothetical protein [Cyclobacteriaceae bacterium]
MRLTTLSRKIEKTPTQLIAFLEKHGFHPEKGLHSILGEQEVALVLQHFMPEDELQETASSTPENPDPIAATVADESPETPEISENIATTVADEDPEISKVELAPDVEVPSEVEAVQPEVSIASEPEAEISDLPREMPKSGTVDDIEHEDFSQVELIKAKKIKLEGFKVVGKIDLPEKPRKEPASASGDEQEEKDTRTTKNPDNIKRGMGRKPKKKKAATLRNPLSYEERLKREEREKLRERKKKEQEEKVRRRKIYEEGVKTKAAAKTAKKKPKHESARTKVAQPVVVHKNPIKRLWAWLNGRYDKF